MQQDNTARIQVPPTERILPAGSAEPPTVRIGPASEPLFDDPRNDKLFDQYTIYSKIGNGGMGVVYLARDRRLGRFVAIKRLNSQAQSIPSLRQRFLHEARAVATLSHVHIVHIYALGEDEDGPFIVMEYVAGPDETAVKSEAAAGGLVQPNPPLTLDQYVSRHGQLSAEEAVDLLLKIGRAVAYAHASGVIHRDLKPSNILLDKSNEPKIVDFGLARLMRKEESKLTVPGEKLLSLGYGAPEQESDASLSDERADVYGLGALLYFALTGQNPRYFREQDVPVPLREVVVKALATDRDQRWQSATAFNEALHHIQTKTRIETPTVKTTWRCKWCDAVNPLALKFCAECGWDGSEACPECGAETFFGVQYCGNCGADARAYEAVLLLLKKMREATEQQRFERVISMAGRVHGFEPAGPSGRQILTDVSQLREQAEKSIRRREQLKEQIPIEIRAENFERAATFISQYQELAEDKRSFDGERQQLPELMLKRDLLRARKALRNREWTSAARLCSDLQGVAAPDNPDVLALRRALRRHTARVDAGVVALTLLAAAAVYLLSLPAAARIAEGAFGPGARTFYRPGLWVYEQSVFAAPLQRYARLWLGGDSALAGCFVPKPEVVPPSVQEPPLPDDLKPKQQDYARQVTEIEEGRTIFQRAWPAEYLRELDLLMERRRMAGDFDGWSVAQQERKRFDDARQLDEHAGETLPELATLSNKYRRMLSDQKLLHSRKLVSLCKRYVNELTDAQKAYTQQDKMELASAVNAEIRRVRHAPGQLAAEAAVASAGDTDADAPVLLASAGEARVQEVAKMRGEFEGALLKVEQAAAKKVAEWPEKYAAALVELMDKFQQAGDYGGWQSVSEESTRFDADRAVMPRNIVMQPVELADLQKKFLSMRDEHRRGRAENVVEITVKHIKDLGALQKKLTVDGQMEAAAIVNAEIKRVQLRAEFIEAQNEVTPQGPPVPPTLKDVVGPGTADNDGKKNF
ncbi:MAG: protein kinase [Verrucomicrobiota bacterium]|jgi:serine/threonine protein kinase|nr:protein kinase [Verrucomicrobiota bacterium]